MQIIPMKFVEEIEGKTKHLPIQSQNRTLLTTGETTATPSVSCQKHKMLLDSANLDLVKWITSEVRRKRKSDLLFVRFFFFFFLSNTTAHKKTPDNQISACQKFI